VPAQVAGQIVGHQFSQAIDYNAGQRLGMFLGCA
jgi:hypothetical protein